MANPGPLQVDADNGGLLSVIEAPAELPNNLGPTLLLAIGFITTPLLIGVPLLLLGLDGLRTAEGHRALPALSNRLAAWRRRLAPWHR
jgi:hypothetical protein